MFMLQSIHMKNSLLLLIALASSSALANAQMFSTGSLALDGSNVENVGSVFEAIDITNGQNYPTLTLNGVTFTQVVGTNGGTTFSNVTSGAGFSVNDLGTDGGRAGGVAASDPVYNLVTDGFYNNSQTTQASQTLTITGLTLGQQYSAQLFFDTGNGDDRAASVTDGTMTSEVVESNNNKTPMDGPKFITEVFTASGTGSESLVINEPAGFGEPLQFSGFVVETVPEPSTYAMMGIGFVALLGVALRKSNARSL